MTDSSRCSVDEITTRMEWSDLLLKLPYPHPMQTWEWGEAQIRSGGEVHRFAVSDAQGCVLLAQVFSRKLRGLPCKLAWVPRGPVSAVVNTGTLDALCAAIKKHGYRILLVQPYHPIESRTLLRRVPFREREFTFVVHLLDPADKTERLLRNKGINRFEREGGIVHEESHEDAIRPLVEEYRTLVKRKGFRAYGGEELIRNTWATFRESSETRISAHVFRAEVGSTTANACLILRVNKTAHFLWAASNHNLRNLGAGEAMQWHVMQRLRPMGVELYDLEGADRKRNPGVYNFKAKLGGRLVERAPIGFKVL